MLIEFSSAQLFILSVAIVWSLIWKGIGLWYSARNRQSVWYIIILLVNTLGILELIYLLFFQRDTNKD
ncbi:MAG: hypothetical protein HQ596_00390 [Candidatus Saganbacteria bacterium]|nr:hypothetical protein [Candidatus Saganbacteria bacterium]